MASCLITTGGTTGTLRINYTLGSDPNSIYSSHGDVIYIDSTATNVTYTTLTGDVTATSGCLTVTALPQTCYLFTLDRPTSNPTTYQTVIDAIVLGGTTSTFSTPGTDDLIGMAALLANINTGLANDYIKMTAFKAVASIITIGRFQISFILKIINSNIPYLRITTPEGDVSYLKGVVSSSCIPTGFTATPYCNPALLT